MRNRKSNVSEIYISIIVILLVNRIHCNKLCQDILRCVQFPNSRRNAAYVPGRAVSGGCYGSSDGAGGVENAGPFSGTKEIAEVVDRRGHLGDEPVDGAQRFEGEVEVRVAVRQQPVSERLDIQGDGVEVLFPLVGNEAHHLTERGFAGLQYKHVVLLVDLLECLLDALIEIQGALAYFSIDHD